MEDNGARVLIGTEEDPNEVVLGRVICEADMPNLGRIQFRILPGQATTMGRMVGVRGRRPSGDKILTLVRVDSVWEKNPHEDALSSTITDVLPFETKYAPEGRSTVIYRAAEGEALEEIILDAAGDIARVDSVETLPLSGSPVVEV